jgi:hypothetical protein
MAKNKRLTIEELLGAVDRGLNQSDLPELIFRLLINLPQREFQQFAWDMTRPELLARFHKAGYTIEDKLTYDDVLKLAIKCGPLMQQLANRGRRQTVEGAALDDFVWTRRRNGRTEGEILRDVRRRFPKKTITANYIKKILRKGRKLGFAQSIPFFQLPTIDQMRNRKKDC